MGETVTRNAGGPPQPPKRSPNLGNPTGSAPGKSTRGDSSTATPGTGNTPAGGSAGGNAGTGKAEETKATGLASVIPPVPETPKKQRKPRQTKKKQEKNNSSYTADQMADLIVSLSMIVASRPGLDMFAISKVEALQVATPLSNILAKSEAFAGMSEHADAFALVTACIVIIAPRVMLYYDAQKQKKINAAGGARLVRTDSKETKASGNPGKTGGNPPAQSEIDDYGIFAAMPPIAD